MDTTHFNNNDKVSLKILINILLSVALKIHSSTPLSAEIVGLTQAVLSSAEHSMLLHFPVLTRDKRAFLEVQVGQEFPGPVLVGELHREPHLRYRAHDAPIFLQLRPAACPRFRQHDQRGQG